MSPSPLSERGSLSVVGTGIKGPGHTTPQTKRHIEKADRVFFLVAGGVAATWIRELNPAAESLHDAYAEGKDRRESYREMVERILAPLREGLTVCAVFYGHPGVFVNPGHEAIRRAREDGHQAEMLPAISAEDCLFADLGVDPADQGCQSFEATDFLARPRRFDTRTALILWQLHAIGFIAYAQPGQWSPEGLRLLVEALRRHYDDDHPAVVYEAAKYPLTAPSIQRVRLAYLAEAEIGTASTLYVSPTGRAPLDPVILRSLGLFAEEPDD